MNKRTLALGRMKAGKMNKTEEVRYFRDEAGCVHDSDTFYADYDVGVM